MPETCSTQCELIRILTAYLTSLSVAISISMPQEINPCMNVAFFVFNQEPIRPALGTNNNVLLIQVFGGDRPRLSPFAAEKSFLCLFQVVILLQKQNIET